MRYFGQRQVPITPAIPDVILSLQLTAATAQAFDYPTGVDMFRVSVGSTIANQLTVYFNPASTGAVVPTTAGTATTATSGHNIPITFVTGHDLSEDEIMELARHSADDSLSPRASGRSRIRIRWLS